MSLANIKRKLSIGQAVEMVYHDWSPDKKPLPKVSGIRIVTRVQTNAVQFSGGSWLRFPSAKQIRETPNGFEVSLTPDFSQVMRYEWR